MTRFVMGVVLALCLWGAPAAQAEDPVDPAWVSARLAGLTGTWDGALYYLDYQNGAEFAIPLSVRGEITPDGKQLVSWNTFTDPGFLVYSVDVTVVDAQTGVVTIAGFRDGRAEVQPFDVTAFEADESGWSLTLERDGVDDDRPARLKLVYTLEGETFRTRKLVTFLDEPGEEFLRNRTELTRVAQDAAPNRMVTSPTP